MLRVEPFGAFGYEQIVHARGGIRRRRRLSPCAVRDGFIVGAAVVRVGAGRAVQKECCRGRVCAEDLGDEGLRVSVKQEDVCDGGRHVGREKARRYAVTTV
jgi:hypothetical protein